MNSHESDHHWRAIAPDGALSPGSSATGTPTSPPMVIDDDGQLREAPHAERSPANPGALIEGNRVTTARDMESHPLTGPISHDHGGIRSSADVEGGA